MLVLLGAALAVKLAGRVAAADAELFHIVLIVAGVIVGVGAVSLGGCWHGDGATPNQTRPAQTRPAP